MNRYLILWKCSKGVARRAEAFWHDHPEIEEVISHLQDAQEAFDQVQAVYHIWRDDDGSEQHSQIH